MENSGKPVMTAPTFAATLRSPDALRRQFWVTHGAIPLMIALLLYVLTEFSKLDLQVSQWLYNAGGGHFYNNWFLSDVMHEGVRSLGRIMAFTLLLLLLGSLVHPRFKRFRMPLLFLVLSISLGSSMTVKLKHITDVYCPSGLALFGGDKPFHSPFDFSRWYSSERGGECWPGGHSAYGFAMWAFYFVAREYRKAWALPALATVFVYGNILGGIRVIQGEHFITHQWWTALLCWFIAVAFYVLLLRRDLLPLMMRIPASAVARNSALQQDL